jgi:S1-C subfamily serine protease
MKKLILFFVLLYLNPLNAQYDLNRLNGYKIVLVPYLFSSLVNEVSKELKDMGFKVYNDESELESDPDFKKDPNLLLICDINKDYRYPHTTIQIKITNIEKSVLFENTDNTKGKSFVSFNLEDDEKWVVNKVFKAFDGFAYNFNSSITLSALNNANMPKLEQTGLTEESIKDYLNKNKTDAIEGIYKPLQSDVKPYYKIGIIKVGAIYKAIVLETDNENWAIGEVKIILEPSSIPSIFSVKYFLGDKSYSQTFAVIENEALLSFEVQTQNNGDKTKITYIKMGGLSSDIDIKSGVLKSTGTGFFLNIKGAIATNAHVVSGAKRLEVVLNTKKGLMTYDAKVLKVDAINDVAIIQIEDDSFKNLPLIPYTFINNMSPGANVFTIGFPINDVMGINYKVANGIISSNSGIMDDVRFYQITVPLQPGNSGGPLFNSKGNIVGITTSSLNDGAVGVKTESVFYSIKVAYLLSLYDMLTDAPKLNLVSTLGNKNLEQQVDVLKEFVCIIKVY